MRLRHVEVFQAILQAGSVSAAAELLCISQPAISKTLQHAEQQLGFALFERHKGKLYPTPEALVLKKEVDTLYQDLQAVKRLAENLRKRNTQELRLEATPAIAQALIPKALNAWQRQFTQHACSLGTNHTEQIIQRLCLHECDLGLTLRLPEHPAVAVTPLAKGCLTVIAPLQTWPVQELSSPLSIEALKHQTLVGLKNEDPLWEPLAQYLEQKNIHPMILTRVQTYQLAYDLVSLGQGLAIVDPFTAYSRVPATVQTRPLKPEIPITLYALHAVDAPLSMPAKQLVQFIQEQAAQMGLSIL